MHTQEYYLLFWTNPGSSTSENSSCIATYLPSHKRFKQYLLGISVEGQTHKQRSPVDSDT